MKRITLLLLLLLGLICFAAIGEVVPTAWTVETSRPECARFDAYHGERILLAATLNWRGKPLSLPEDGATLFFQTNGMGAAWWTLPARTHLNTISAILPGEMDTGADLVHGFLGYTGVNYRAEFSLRFRPSPGFRPNVISPPVVTLDFAALTVVHPELAPWPTEAETAAAIGKAATAATNYTDEAIGSIPPSADVMRGFGIEAATLSDFVVAMSDNVAYDPALNRWYIAGETSATGTVAFVYRQGSREVIRFGYKTVREQRSELMPPASSVSYYLDGGEIHVTIALDASMESMIGFEAPDFFVNRSGSEPWRVTDLMDTVYLLADPLGIYDLAGLRQWTQSKIEAHKAEGWSRHSALTDVRLGDNRLRLGPQERFSIGADTNNLTLAADGLKAVEISLGSGPAEGHLAITDYTVTTSGVSVIDYTAEIAAFDPAALVVESTHDLLKPDWQPVLTGVARVGNSRVTIDPDGWHQRYFRLVYHGETSQVVAITLSGIVNVTGDLAVGGTNVTAWMRAESSRMDALERNRAAGAARPLPPYLHEVSFDSSYPEDAEWYYAHADDIVGGCSVRRVGNMIERNYDWMLDDAAEFVVRVSPGANRYGSIGVATVGTNLTEDIVTSGKWSMYYKCLPGRTLDGINECGVMAEINVVATNGAPWETRGDRDINAIGGVRWALDHAASAGEAASNLAERVYIPASMTQMGYSCHYAICDRDETWIVEDGTAERVGAGVPPVMTNFRLLTPDPTGSGYERYAVLTNAASSITNVWWTNAYVPSATPWVSDIGSDTGHVWEVWASADRETHRREGKWWQSVHTSVYDLDAKALKIAVQERDDWYEFSLEPSCKPLAGRMFGLSSEAARTAALHAVIEALGGMVVTPEPSVPIREQVREAILNLDPAAANFDSVVTALIKHAVIFDRPRNANELLLMIDAPSSVTNVTSFFDYYLAPPNAAKTTTEH